MRSIACPVPLVIWFIFAPVAVVQLACSESVPDRLSAVPSEAEAVCNTPFTSVFHGRRCGPQFRDLRVVEDEAEWCRFWDEIPSCSPTPAVCDTSTVDFDLEVAVIAALGTRPDGCYDVEISCIHTDEESNDTLIFVRELAPGAGCFCLDEIITPFDIVKVDRPIRQATFEMETTVRDCE